MTFRHFWLLFVCSTGALSAATVIDFNDGTDGQGIGTFYGSIGVTFSNAEWDSLTSGYTPDPSSTGLRLVADGSNYQPKSSDPIVVTFQTPITIASIIANNVNLNGARIDAFDQLVGGTVIDFHQVVGASGAQNSNFLLQVSGPSIRRLELYQPFSAETEGVLFDNLSFTSVPESSTALALLPALVFFTGRRRVSPQD